MAKMTWDAFERGFIEGYKAALADKRYSEEDMVNHLSNLIEGYNFDTVKSWAELRGVVRQYLQSLQDTNDIS